MALFRYEVTSTHREDFVELGTIRAKDESEAKAKLNQYGFDKVRLARIRGVSALWKRFTADIR